MIIYHIYPKYFDRQAWANSVDRGQKLHSAAYYQFMLLVTHPAVFRQIERQQYGLGIVKNEGVSLNI